MESQRVRHLFDLCLCWWVDCLCWSEFIPNISPPLLITPSPRCTPTLRCLWPASAVESMSQGRTSTRQKPCSPKKETPALLRCTPASLAVRHRYTNIPHCLINMSYPVSAVSSVISIMLTLCVCVCVCVQREIRRWWFPPLQLEDSSSTHRALPSSRDTLAKASGTCRWSVLLMWCCSSHPSLTSSHFCCEVWLSFLFRSMFVHTVLLWSTSLVSTTSSHQARPIRI